MDFPVFEGTVGHEIIFGSQQDDPLVVGYVDSDYAGDLDDRRSTTCMFLLLVEGQYVGSQLFSRLWHYLQPKLSTWL